MTRSIWLVGLLCSGCFVVPATKTTVRDAGTEQSALTPGRTKSIQLQTGASRTTVRVRATSTRECHRQIYAISEVTKSHHARMGGVDDPRAAPIAAILAPVTLPVSALVTGLILLGDSDEKSRVSRPLRTETEECTTEAAGLALQLQYPSGHIYNGTTDKNGVLVHAIPGDEPYVGDVAVRGDSVTAQVHYEQPLPAVTATRDAVDSCQKIHQISGGTLKLTIDERGFATRVWLSTGDAAFSDCVSAKIAGRVFPDRFRASTVVVPFEAPAT